MGRRSNRAVFQFALIFVAVSAAGIAFEYYLMANDAAQGYRALVASTGNWLPRLIGVQSHANGSTITVAGRALEVTPECSGIEAMGVFLAGVLAFPCGRRNTSIGIALGFVGVGLLNVMRVSALTIVAGWMPNWFGPTHDALTHLFPLFAVLPLWLVWLAFVVRRQRPERPTDRSARNTSVERPAPNLKGT
jgi:exosortase/archaeosortase family protein